MVGATSSERYSSFIKSAYLDAYFNILCIM